MPSGILSQAECKKLRVFYNRTQSHKDVGKKPRSILSNILLFRWNWLHYFVSKDLPTLSKLFSIKASGKVFLYLFSMVLGNSSKFRESPRYGRQQTKRTNLSNYYDACFAFNECSSIDF